VSKQVTLIGTSSGSGSTPRDDTGDSRIDHSGGEAGRWSAEPAVRVGSRVGSRDGRTRPYFIQVHASQGVVHLVGTLQGTVPSSETHVIAREIAAGVAGVRSAVGELFGIDDAVESPSILTQVGVPVYAADGELGRLEAVVMSPRSRQVTHLVVAGRFLLAEADDSTLGPESAMRRLLVPARAVAHATADVVHLHVDRAAATRLPEYPEGEYVVPDPGWQPTFDYRREDIRLAVEASAHQLTSAAVEPIAASPEGPRRWRRSGKDVQPMQQPMKQPMQAPRGGMARWARSSLVQMLAGLFAYFLIQQLIVAPMATRAAEIPYSQFKADLRSGNVQTVTLGKDRIAGTLKDPANKDGKPFNVVAVEDPGLARELDAAGVEYQGQPSSDGGFLGVILGWLLPLGLMAGFYYFVILRGLRGMGGMKGGAGGIFSFGKSKAIPITGEQTGVTFGDVGGADEAVAELREVVDYLKHPAKYQRLGGRIPKGVLLVGPPGAGKTLLARATAGEAGVTFYSITGSSFVEMFAGVGAARVRDLFEQAKAGAPSIVFIDEIDAVGRQRSGASALNTHEEREQTLNQLLSEMDGFEANKGVIIMAATNRPEILDPALLRAGRFDRQVVVDVPDLVGREQILAIHLRNVQLSRDAVVATIARMTPGFTGADLANIVNEAALLAARRDKPTVTLRDFEEAIERVVAGLERRTRVMSESEKQVVAYHEAGHALVANLLPGADPVRKVSIVPRGKGALGYTLQLPTQDRYVLTQRELEARLAVLMGGRAAEELVFESPSTGASDDLARATDLARRMVAEFGMSPELGPVRYSGDGAGGYLGPDLRLQPGVSPETAACLDREIRRIVEEGLERARQLLRERRPALDGLAEGLLRKEVLDGEEMAAIVGRSVAPDGRTDLPAAA